MIKILILLNSLDQGGAERQLITLLEGIDKKEFQPIVVTYYPGGLWEDYVRQCAGIHYHCLNLRSRFDLYSLIVSLNTIVRKYNPQIIYGLLGDACTLALLHGRFFRKHKVVWGLRATNIDFTQYSKISGWIYTLNAKLSKFVDVIVSNSWAGFEYHAQQGYKREKIMVIPNGIDTIYFSPNYKSGRLFRSHIGLDANTVLIGRIGRLDPMKDYPTFLKAAAYFKKHSPNTRYLIVGSGSPKITRDLRQLAHSLGLSKNILWLGEHNDLSAIYNACTITTSSSCSESFPNVVAESMACEVPCIATDVGDSAIILNEPSLVVPPRDPKSLADAWHKVLSMSIEKRKELGRQGRLRIKENFSQMKMITATQHFLQKLCN